FCRRVWQARHQAQRQRVMNADLVQADFDHGIEWQVGMCLAFFRAGTPSVRVGGPVLAAGNDSGASASVVPSTR
ncbi:MAG: hypothetical protein NT013_00665, partial [Planctomycetia bacterium]|nr:hypothetical protein [Planctomycetia bacterium]